MPPQAPGALDQGAHRRQIGNHDIETNVQGLLQDLRADNHPTSSCTGRRGLAEGLHHVAFIAKSVPKREARVMQHGVHATRPQRGDGCNRLIDRIAHKRASRAALGGIGQDVETSVQRVEPLDRHATHGNRDRFDGRYLGRVADHRDLRIMVRQVRHVWPRRAALESPDEARPHAQRQRRRHQNSRAAEHGVEGQQRFQLGLHERIIIMGLVDHEYLARQGVESQGIIARRQHAEQHLIDRTDADLGEKRLAATIGKPLRAGDRVRLGLTHRPALQVAKRVVKPRAAVGEGKRRFAVEHGAKRGQPRPHRVRCRHRRQREEQPVTLADLQHPVRQHQRRFSLARPGRILDDGECLARRQFGGEHGALHRGKRVERKELAGIPLRRRRATKPRHLQGNVRPFARNEQIACNVQFGGGGRKPGGVRADPIGDADQAGEPSRQDRRAPPPVSAGVFIAELQGFKTGFRPKRREFLDHTACIGLGLWPRSLHHPLPVAAAAHIGRFGRPAMMTCRCGIKRKACLAMAAKQGIQNVPVEMRKPRHGNLPMAVALGFPVFDHVTEAVADLAQIVQRRQQHQAMMLRPVKACAD